MHKLLFNASPLWFLSDSTVLQSWEIGTLAEALTEAEWPRLSVFLPGSVLPPYSLPWWESAFDVLLIAEM